MSLLPKLVERLQRHPKRVVFPEGADPRILQAARQWVTRRMGVPVLLGDRARVKEAAAALDVNLAGIRLIDPSRSEDFEEFVRQFEALRRDKGLKPGEARGLLADSNYFATMMLATAQVDALVGGATVSASSALRPLFQIIPLLEHVRTASSLMILDWDEQKVGIDGSLFLADCSVIPEPTAEQLADIAIATAMIAHHLTNELPRVALLSYASKGSASHPALLKMRRATELARAKAAGASLPMEVDGELQVDAALDVHVAETKKVAGARRRPRERPHLSRPRQRQHRLQARAGPRRREHLRPDRDGTQPARGRNQPRRKRARRVRRRRRRRLPGDRPPPAVRNAVNGARRFWVPGSGF